MNYTLQLTEEKVKMHQVTALHLTSALAFMGAGAIVYVYNDIIKPWGMALLIEGFSLLLLTLFKNKLVTTSGNFIIRIAELLIAGTFGLYSSFMHWNLPLGIFGVLSGALVFALYWERKGNAIQYVYFDESGIKLPFESRKSGIQWTEVENVLFRFGTLSINCSDNRLFQWNVEPPDFNPAQLEQYCSRLIEANRGKRRKDDW